MAKIITAAMVVIGDEILSGRTKDCNIGYLADMLRASAIALEEVRIVSDQEQAIVDSVNQLRGRYDYVFTSGGIGPTHDDITAQSVSKAFNLACIYDDKAMALLKNTYEKRAIEFTPARQRMARMPQGATHIANPVSVAPGFSIENVHVMAGVPAVFKAMLTTLIPTLETGSKIHSKSVNCTLGEGVIGEPLGEIQNQHIETVIGSYPKFRDGQFSTEIVVSSPKLDAIDDAIKAVEIMILSLTQKEVS